MGERMGGENTGISDKLHRNKGRLFCNSVLPNLDWTLVVGEKGQPGVGSQRDRGSAGPPAADQEGNPVIQLTQT